MSERPRSPFNGSINGVEDAAISPEMHPNNCHEGFTQQTDMVTWRQTWHQDKRRDGNRTGPCTVERLKVSVYMESMFEGK